MQWRVSPIISTLANASAYGFRSLSAAAAGAYESIASATGTGSSGTITFSSIPSTYVALQIRGIFKSDAAGISATYFNLRLNGDTTTLGANHYLKGDGSLVSAGASASTTSYGQINDLVARASTGTNIMGVGIIDIHDYASTTRNKSVRSAVGYDANGSGAVTLMSNLWPVTSAVSSMSLVLNTGNWTTATQVALYGIKGASMPATYHPIATTTF